MTRGASANMPDVSLSSNTRAMADITGGRRRANCAYSGSLGSAGARDAATDFLEHRYFPEILADHELQMTSAPGVTQRPNLKST
jgi:hypothetical protein